MDILVYLIVQSVGEDLSSSALIHSLQLELEDRDHRISALQHQLEIYQVSKTGPRWLSDMTTPQSDFESMLRPLTF